MTGLRHLGDQDSGVVMALTHLDLSVQNAKELYT